MLPALLGKLLGKLAGLGGVSQPTPKPIRVKSQEDRHG